MRLLDAKGATVFLDRDGTINVDTGYVSNPDTLELIPGAGRAIRRLNDAGVKVVVVSNQSGVGRGMFTGADVEAVNDRLAALLRVDAGARIDAVYFCPHHPDDNCPCRKPMTLLAQRAVAEHGIELSRAYVVGDKASDVWLGRNLNVKTVLVLTGDGKKELSKLNPAPDFVADDLSGAVDMILADLPFLKER
ncbi:MAG: HAD family hydrolase [Deltaproteobacteria bacterium]|nr:HAD family hydrolase [Deltaproteobacteria bacterium]